MKIYRLWVSPYKDKDFEWDEEKSLATYDDRGLVFEAARIIFRGPLLRCQDLRKDYGEPRYMVLGELYGRITMIIYTPRGKKCRIISLRPANTAEREIYDGYRTDET